MSAEEGLKIQIAQQKLLVGEALCPKEDGTLCDACEQGQRACELKLAIKELRKQDTNIKTKIAGWGPAFFILF